MKYNFEDLKIGSYYRDRVDEASYTIAYFEEIKIDSIKDDKIFGKRIHIHLTNRGEISKTVDSFNIKKRDWDLFWSDVNLFTKRNKMNRRMVRYTFEQG